MRNTSDLQAEITSDEGICKWFALDELSELKMPFFGSIYDGALF